MTRFDSVWLKLSRAKQHIDDLEAAIIAFHRTNPYPIVTEDDPQRGKRVVKVKGKPSPIPSAIPLIFGDAVHAIRSSLDYFAYAVARNPPDITKVAFPIWRKGIPTAEKFQATASGKIPGASEQLMQAIYALQPYLGGNGEQIWAIDQLDIIDKHRVLIVIDTYPTHFQFDASGLFAGLDVPYEIPPMPWAIRFNSVPIEDGTILFEADPEDFEKQKDLQFTFNIAFGEPEILERKPVVPTLRGLLDEVESLLKRLVPLV
jgi:hypothetical protein